MTGYAITVRINEERDFAKDFLNVFNNVKVDEDLLAITTDGHSTITVTVVEPLNIRFGNWLGQFGEIIDREKVLLCPIKEVDYDLDEYDDVCYYVES